MAANLITLFRIVLSFLTVFLFQGNFYCRLSAVIIILFVIYLDALDGIIARKLGIESDFGAIFDITGDRIVEHIFWIFFTAVGLVSVWVPITYICRSFLVDTLRSMAYAKKGETPFGKNNMMQSSVTNFLTASRFCRAAYGFGKVAAFIMLGCILTLQQSPEYITKIIPDNTTSVMWLATSIVVWLAVSMNLIRGLPVLWDGRHLVLDSISN